MSIVKKLLSYLFLFFIISLIINLSKDVWNLLHADERIAQTEEKLEKLKKENVKLNQEYDYRQNDEYMEEEIRNKLQMAKPGETIVILPQELNGSGETSEDNENQDQDVGFKNWQKWLNLFI